MSASCLSPTPSWLKLYSNFQDIATTLPSDSFKLSARIVEYANYEIGNYTIMAVKDRLRSGKRISRNAAVSVRQAGARQNGLDSGVEIRLYFMQSVLSLLLFRAKSSRDRLHSVNGG